MISTLNVSFRISFGCCGRFTVAEMASLLVSAFIVLLWIVTGHWLLMDGKFNSKSSNRCLGKISKVY